MFLVQRPSQQSINRFIDESKDLPLSYGPIGLVRPESAHDDVVDVAVTVGRGRDDFERACAALVAWKHFDIGWVELFPERASIDPGTVVAVLIRHLGFWSLNGCRVVYRVGDDGAPTTFGFAYGTLTNHAESGEELFEVRADPRTDEVTYRIRAWSRPRAALARLGHPVARLLQARFRRDSAEAMKRATRDDQRNLRHRFPSVPLCG